MSRKKEFYDTLVNLISEKGFKATTMRDIAFKMECDVSNLYNYITSKQSFLEELLFKMNSYFHSRMDEIIESGLPPTKQLEEVIRLYVEVSASQPREVGILHNEWRHLRGDRLTDFLAEKLKFESKISSIIKSGIERGAFKSMQPNILTHLVLSSLRLLFIHPEISKNTLQSHSQITEFILHGINKR